MENIWGIAKDVLSTVAPVLATAVGGPLAGTATNAIIAALGLDPSTPPDQVAAAVKNATPEQLLALKTADNNFKVQMKQLDIDVTKMGYDDTANARQLQMTTKDLTPGMLAFLITAGFFGLVGTMAFISLPVANQSALQIVLGALSSGWVAMMHFYFGSSAGSASKNMLLFNSQPSK